MCVYTTDNNEMSPQFFKRWECVKAERNTHTNKHSIHKLIIAQKSFEFFRLWKNVSARIYQVCETIFLPFWFHLIFLFCFVRYECVFMVCDTHIQLNWNLDWIQRKGHWKYIKIRHIFGQQQKIWRNRNHFNGYMSLKLLEFQYCDCFPLPSLLLGMAGLWFCFWCALRTIQFEYRLNWIAISMEKTSRSKCSGKKDGWSFHWKRRGGGSSIKTAYAATMVTLRRSPACAWQDLYLFTKWICDAKKRKRK